MPFIDELKLLVEQREDCRADFESRSIVVLPDDDDPLERGVYTFSLTGHPNGGKRAFVWQQENSVGERDAVYKIVLAGPNVRDPQAAVLHELNRIKNSL